MTKRRNPEDARIPAAKIPAINNVGQDRYEHPSEDDITRADLGPRGVPGAPDPAKMTPQREKKTPKPVTPGHTA